VRITSDREKQLEMYKKFAAEVEKDRPALFTYAPNFIYVMPKRVKGVELRAVSIPSERFLGIHRWYLETDRVWRAFLSNETLPSSEDNF
ncbi:MAG: Uncharacterized protein G01um101472_263, partial [Parcubacteria group bacterium Gr01-1014_72]